MLQAVVIEQPESGIIDISWGCCFELRLEYYTTFRLIDN